jgi:glutamate carboxypeptidase
VDPRVTTRVSVDTDRMLGVLQELVEVESFSSDAAAVLDCAQAVARIGESMLGVDAEIIGETHPAVRFTFGTGASRVMLLGHFDTVWPIGTIARWPFSVSDGIATGPGVFDMKAGIVQGFFALAGLEDRDGVRVLLTSDEEIGAPGSRELIESMGREAAAVLVLEPSEKGALKLARKGQATYRIDAHGKAAHSGLNPWDGANALTALSHAIGDLERVADGDTTVTPTLAQAGSAMNTVPAQAHCFVDVRTFTAAEQDRVGKELDALESNVEGVRLEIECLHQRGPLERSASADLFVRAQRVATQLGLEPLEGVAVGGASDGNFTAALGTPTLDGLGPVGAGAHAEGEHVLVDKMPERAALVAALVTDLLEEGKD